MPVYNLIEYSSNYSETTGSLKVKLFKYKAKLLGNTAAKPALIAVSLKYLSNSWRSLEIPLIAK